jgi:hypothetical protein
VGGDDGLVAIPYRPCDVADSMAMASDTRAAVNEGVNVSIRP